MFHGPLTLSSRAQQTRTTRLTMEFTASSQPRRTCAWSSFFAPPSACGSFSSCPLVHIHLHDFLHLLWPGLHLLQCHEVPPTTFLKLLSSSSSVCRPQSSSISFFCIFRELTFRLDISVFFGWSTSLQVFPFSLHRHCCSNLMLVLRCYYCCSNLSLAHRRPSKLCLHVVLALIGLLRARLRSSRPPLNCSVLTLLHTSPALPPPSQCLSVPPPTFCDISPCALAEPIL